MNKLARQLIKLAYENPELRPPLRPILDKLSNSVEVDKLAVGLEGILYGALTRCPTVKPRPDKGMWVTNPKRREMTISYVAKAESEEEAREQFYRTVKPHVLKHVNTNSNFALMAERIVILDLDVLPNGVSVTALVSWVGRR